MSGERSEGVQRTAADASGPTSPGLVHPGAHSPLPVTDEDRLAAWRAFYPGFRDPLPRGAGSYDAQMDHITLESLGHVIENDRQRVADRA